MENLEKPLTPGEIDGKIADLTRGGTTDVMITELVGGAPARPRKTILDKTAGIRLATSRILEIAPLPSSAD